MSRYHAIINKAVSFLGNYSGQVPLTIALKSYYKANRNMGSTDRKVFGNLIFNFYRIKGNQSIESDWQIMHYVALSVPQLFVEAAAQLKIDVVNNDLYSIEVIRDLLHFEKESYFPMQTAISDLIDQDIFLTNHHKPANTFLRVKNGEIEIVKAALSKLQYAFIELDNRTISCPLNYPLTELPEYAKGLFEIQDIASQKTSDFLEPKKGDLWWDCCCGSGGKSLLLLEKEPDIKLYATDVRESILRNYEERIERNGFSQPHVFNLDLIEDKSDLTMLPDFDGVIADVPCSGSGTWSRTPEWLHFFHAQLLNEYVKKQRKIFANILPKIKSGGQLIYCTCSVYKDENENNVGYFANTHPLQLLQMHYVQNSHLKGDTLFVAQFIKQ